jgi:putative ABC transport system permease protein
MFNLEKAIKKWKKNLLKHDVFEDGLLADFELHLRDAYDAQRRAGLDEEAAFCMAVSQVGTADSIASEYIKNRLVLLNRRSPLHPGKFMPALVWNYIKIVLRNLKKYKAYSLINITGLAVGLACCTLIFLWVSVELSTDGFHKDGDNLYRIIRGDSVDPTRPSVVTPLPLSPAIKEELPEVLASTRIQYVGRRLFRYENMISYENNCMVVDEDFFNMFSFPLIAGDPSAVFSDPYAVVLTEATAQKYFGAEEAVGKTIIVDNRYSCLVTGVLSKEEYPSHIQFDCLFSFRLLAALGVDMEEWQDVSYLAYVLLHPESDLDYVREKISDVITRNAPEYSTVQRLQLVKDIHNERIRGYIIGFSTVAIMVLIVACINFMNLSTARSGYRAKEISMRKVAGAQRSDLIKQFLGESFLMTLIAFVLAILLVSLFLPQFEHITEDRISLDQLKGFTLLVGFVAIALLTGFLSGIYPALFFAKMHPLTVLKGYTRAGRQGASVRKGLVVVQFSLSVILIICTFTILKQIHFVNSSDLGYTKENILYVGLGEFRENADAIKQDLLNHPDIKSISLIDNLFLGYGWGTDNPEWEGKAEEHKVQFSVRTVDYDFLETFQVEMAEGRFFSETFPSDKGAFVLNEAAVKAMNMESPVGKWFRYPYYDREGMIIGVVKDFHFSSLHMPIEPFFMMIMPSEYRYMCMRISSQGIRDTINFIGEKWKTYSPNFPIEYRFLDQTVGQMYQSEQRSGQLLGYFTAIAILISTLGLFGLISFMLEQRSKEIGIRRVLGSSVGGIVNLFTKTFLKLVIVANVVAWPASFWIMNQWLKNYAYKTGLSWWIFVAAGLSAVMVAFLTIGIQTLRAAMANPADLLRYE